MVWAITASNVGVDIDLLFEENSTIGQRIKLSENIVLSLVRMQCPHPLQSHQIQGLDYDHILPILRWLVRRVIETRRLTGDVIRAQSVAAFARDFTLPQDQKTSSALEFVSTTATRYKSQRKFKKREGAIFDSDVGRVEATLLEYDEKLIGFTNTIDEEQEEKRREKIAEGKLKASDDTENTEEVQRRQVLEDRKRIASLQNQLSENQAVTQKVSGSLVSQILSMRADAISQAEQAYETAISTNAPQLSAKDIKLAEEQRYQRRIDKLQRKLDEILAQNDLKSQEYEHSNQHLQKIQLALQEIEQSIEEATAETNKLIEIENSSENQEMLAKLKSLVALVEDIKKNETLFKQMCRSEHKRLSDAIEALQKSSDDDESRKLQEITDLIHQDQEKLGKLRQLIALRNQEIARAERAIGEVPTRAELLQFERRFVELYELVAEKLIESRKYYDLYNRLNTQYQYMQSQLSILESIITNFPIGMQSDASRKLMLDQFRAMLESVDLSREDVETSFLAARENEKKLTAKHDSLLETQRSYFKLVKEFQDECNSHEILTLTLEDLQNGGDGTKYLDETTKLLQSMNN